ncbi:aldo/keto reductase [Pelagicoccus mobilis]|uniref:Aldo/keto reductase n=1 Tax=Pelagicoccus mobilis TaxID=415221 RepID=A0A934VPA4_9BACT|nr:aldo/keto reductase [Pelagicoccus mobilis]MBK1875615.1 aldo/keto reductase [Pelagicoccus mobilis]
MKRREFVRNAAIAGGGMWALGHLSSAWAADVKSAGMAYETLGRTGVRVSKIGLGCAPLGRDTANEKESARIVDRCIDAGINYFDTAPNYTAGESERHVGNALRGKRDKVFLVSKTEEASYEGTWRLLEASLKHLKTDYLDLVHLHNFGHEGRFPNLDFLFSDEGAMGALRKAKEKGMIRFIGASGHLHPSRFHYAIDSEEIDALMVAVNYINQHTYDFEHKIWTRAGDKNLGLVSMKVFGGGRRKFKIPEEDYEIAMRYTLSLPKLSTAVIGLGSEAYLEKALETLRRVKPLDDDEFIEVAQRGLELVRSDAKWRAAHGQPLT